MVVATQVVIYLHPLHLELEQYMGSFLVVVQLELLAL